MDEKGVRMRRPWFVVQKNKRTGMFGGEWIEFPIKFNRRGALRFAKATRACGFFARVVRCEVVR